MVLQITYLPVEGLKPYENNPRKNKKGVEIVKKSIQAFGFKNPIIIDKNNVIIAGHTRLEAAKLLNLSEVPVIYAEDLTPEQVNAFRIMDNKSQEYSEWNNDLLKKELENLKALNFDLELTGFKEAELNKLVPDNLEEGELPDPEKPKYDVNKGDIYQLGEHRLFCGDCTIKDNVDKLMNGQKADMVFTDPPYGMKKENEGITNDNLNYEDLLEFNKKWIPLSFEYLKENNSWYCWGTDEPLMDIYSTILKPLIKSNKATFRNLITWNKGNGQGQLSENYRMYAIADEKCLFVMTGVQGFSTNADNYYKGWEPIRKYLEEERKKAGWDIPSMKRAVGHSDLYRDHWTGKSQWTFPTEEVYKNLQKASGYNSFKKEYDEIKKEYDEIKKEYYSTRAYFNNIHDNMNNIWNFPRDLKNEHATPKPLELCKRGILTSSRTNEIVLDIFGGSGSTLIACEQTNRKCYMMELDEKYCSVIIERFINLVGDKEVYKIKEDGTKEHISKR